MVEILREQGRHDIADEIERLRAELREATQLVIRLQKERMMREVNEAFAQGTLSQTQEQRQEFGIIDNVPPNAPR